MKTKLEDGYVSVLLSDLLDSLSTEENRDLADTLACQESVIADVASQILTGWTELMSHGSKGGVDAKPHTALDKAIREVALRSGEVAKTEIHQLSHSLTMARKEWDEWRSTSRHYEEKFNSIKRQLEGSEQKRKWAEAAVDRLRTEASQRTEGGGAHA